MRTFTMPAGPLGVFAVLVLAVAVSADPPSEEQRRAARDKGADHLSALVRSGKLGEDYTPWIKCNHYAVTGLVLLCEGSGWGTGKYGQEHEKIVSFIRDNRFRNVGEATYYMGVWGHCYMVWYMAELADTAPASARQPLDALAIQLIAELSSWQSKASGGWGHHPELLPTRHGYTEFSVITSLALSSLLRAREKGYLVDEAVIEGAFKYLDKTITGRAGEPRYSAEANVAAGNQREGAPRGALVMLPYALDKRTTPGVRLLLQYLRGCKDFTAGHASASLGMCHSALLFASIDEYGYFWKLHGQSILARQKDDGSFNPLPPGERTDAETDGSLSDAFHTLTLALPEAPWRWNQPALPVTSNASVQRTIARAADLAGKDGTPASIAKFKALNQNDPAPKLTGIATNYFRTTLREVKPTDDAHWLAAALDPYLFCQVVPGKGPNMEVNIVLPPHCLVGVQADARLMHTDKELATAKLRSDMKKALSRRLIVRDAATIDPQEIKIEVEWAWGGRTFTTEHSLLSATATSTK